MNKALLPDRLRDVLPPDAHHEAPVAEAGGRAEGPFGPHALRGEAAVALAGDSRTSMQGH